MKKIAKPASSVTADPPPRPTHESRRANVADLEGYEAAPVREPMIQITMRIEPEIVRWLDVCAAAEQARNPRRRVTRSDLARDILWNAMLADTASPGRR